MDQVAKNITKQIGKERKYKYDGCVSKYHLSDLELRKQKHHFQIFVNEKKPSCVNVK